jgi:hypothetical protein
MKTQNIIAVLVLLGAQAAAAQDLGPAVDAGSQQGAASRLLHANVIQAQSFEYVVPELIIGGDWTSTIRLTNRSTTTIPRTNVYMVDNQGGDLKSTFQVTDGSVITDSTFSFTLPPGTMVEVTFLGNAPAFGHAIIDFCGSATKCANAGLYGEVSLRNRFASRPDFESIFPLERPATLQYMLFDGRAGLTTVLYIANQNTATTQVALDVRGTNNALLRTVNFAIPALSSQILTLHALSTETLGIQGTLVFRTSTPQSFITVTGLRINPSNSFTPLRAFLPPI